MMREAVKDPKDKWILIYFILFFGTIFILDGIFVYLALTTHRGTVIEKPYERGLSYNKILSQAKNQPIVKEKFSFEDNTLRWELADKSGQDVLNAKVTVKIIRQVQDGYDFDVILNHQGSGVYIKSLDMPLKGEWLAKINSEWDNHNYKTTYKFIVQ